MYTLHSIFYSVQYEVKCTINVNVHFTLYIVYNVCGKYNILNYVEMSMIFMVMCTTNNEQCTL